MNKNNDNKSTPYGDSSTPSSQPGDANAKAGAGGQGRNQPQSQNQPQKQNLPEQQHQLQNPKPNQQGGSNPQVAGKSDAECQEAMRKMEEAGRPGPAHQALEPLIGDWKAEVKCWQEGSAAAHVTQGTAESYWILQGRFLKEDFTGEMMGKPFKGQTLLGFDNIKQTYNLVWLADTTTSIFTSEGRGDSGNRVITLEGQATCPQRGQIAVKSVYRILGADKHVFEMYHEGRKSLEVTYTRA